MPADQACSLDFVNANGGSNHASTLAPTSDTVAVATASAMTLSVLNGRCGPCCSVAPIGSTRIDPSFSSEATLGARSSAKARRCSVTSARYPVVPRTESVPEARGGLSFAPPIDMLFLYRPRETWMPFAGPRNRTDQAAYNRQLQQKFESTRRVAPAAPAPRRPHVT